MNRKMASRPLNVEAFPTDLGWMAIAGSKKEKVLFALTLGHAGSGEALRAILRSSAESSGRSSRSAKLMPPRGRSPGLNSGGFVPLDEERVEIGPWHAALLKRLVAYASGTRDEFRDIAIEQSHLTDFQRRVISACREVGYGQTASYGQLAELAGAPRAARAVGNTMAINRYPLVVPCHRIVASAGPGGFSAGRGLTLKLQLLQLESAGLARPRSRKKRLASSRG